MVAFSHIFDGSRALHSACWTHIWSVSIVHLFIIYSTLSRCVCLRVWRQWNLFISWIAKHREYISIIMTVKIKHKRFRRKCKIDSNPHFTNCFLRLDINNPELSSMKSIWSLSQSASSYFAGSVNKSKPRRLRYAYPMPTRKGLLAPQNTFLDTIATRFDGTRKFDCLLLWTFI